MSPLSDEEFDWLVEAIALDTDQLVFDLAETVEVVDRIVHRHLEAARATDR